MLQTHYQPRSPNLIMKTGTPKTLIIGSGGRLGKELLTTFREDNVTGLDRKALDIGNLSSIEKALSRLEFDRVIITASLTAVDYCEDHKEESFRVNADAPGLIAEIAKSKGAHTTYISTDFVFDGQCSEPIIEDALPHPLSVYGASKLKGEEEVLTSSRDNLVARVSWLFGPSRPAFPEWILGKASAEEELSLPADKVACPTLSIDVASFLKSLLDQQHTPASGIYHICNSDNCTWQEWGQSCLDLARKSGFTLKANTIGKNLLGDIAAFKAERPKYSALNNSKLARFLGHQPRKWETALEAHLQTSFKENQQPVAAS